MKAIRFKGSEYNMTGIKALNGQTRPKIPVRRETNGQTISCWRAPFLQRLAFLIHGKIWIGVQTNGRNLPPLWAACTPTVFTKKQQTIKEAKK